MRSIVVSLAVVLVAAGPALAKKEAPAPKPDQVVLAKVNETVITLDDFQDAVSALPPQQQFLALSKREEFLDSLVKREIVFQEATRLRLETDPSVATLLTKLKKEVLIQALLRQIIEKTQKVTEAEAERHYLDNSERFKTPEKITASHIVVKTEEEAKEILADLTKGKDFAELAKERSIGPRASEEGRLGSITRGEMPVEFDRVAFNLPVGSLSDVVKTPFGYHIIKVTENTPPKQLGFREVSKQIHEHLQARRQQEAVRAFIEELSKKTPIETYPERLAGPKP